MAPRRVPEKGALKEQRTQRSTSRRLASTKKPLLEKNALGPDHQPAKSRRLPPIKEDVYDIPDSSPEKPRKPPSRAVGRPRKPGKPQGTEKQPQKRRGRPVKAVSKRATVPTTGSEDELASLDFLGSEAGPERGESPLSEAPHRHQQKPSSPPMKRRKDNLTNSPSQPLESEPQSIVSPRRSTRLIQKRPESISQGPATLGPQRKSGMTAIPKHPRESSTIISNAVEGTQTAVPARAAVPSHAAASNIANDEADGSYPKSPKTIVKENVTQVSSASDSDSDGASWTSESGSEKSDAPDFEAFDHYDGWLIIKEAASSVGVLETDNDHIKRKLRARTKRMKELLVLARRVTSCYKKLRELSFEERRLAFARPIPDDAETVFQELKLQIDSIRVDDFKSGVIDFLTDVYRVIIPYLVYLLGKAMAALSPVYAEKSLDESGMACLKIIINIQSQIIELCQIAKAWKAQYARTCKIQDIGKTTKQILPTLRDRLKPAFEREYHERRVQLMRNEQMIIDKRNRKEKEARRSAEPERSKAAFAERTRLQMIIDARNVEENEARRFAESDRSQAAFAERTRLQMVVDERKRKADEARCLAESERLKAAIAERMTLQLQQIEHNNRMNRRLLGYPDADTATRGNDIDEDLNI